MFARLKAISVIVILFLSAIIVGSNFGLVATNPANDSPRGAELRSNGFDWSQIEVISEPIFGQNFNVLNSMFSSIVVENGKIYTVWQDRNDTNGAGADDDIFYRYFDGTTWSNIQVISEPVVGLNTNTNVSFNPGIAVENGKIYVVWNDNTTMNGAGPDYDLFYRCNITGSGWEDIQIISEPVQGKNFNTGESSGHSSILVDNGKIYVVWHDENDTYSAGTDTDIFYRTNLTGSDWEPVQVLSEPVVGQDLNTDLSIDPEIAVENDNIYVVWEDANNTNGASVDRDIFYRCNLSGSSWEDLQIISEPVAGQNFNTQHSQVPAIAVENGKIYVVWEDNNNTNGAGGEEDIFYKCNLTGTNWEDVQVISEPVPDQDINIYMSVHPSIAVETGKIYIAWEDKNDTNGCGAGPNDYDIFFRANLTGSSWEPVQVLSEPVFGQDFNTGWSARPGITVENNGIFVVWMDNNETNGAGTDWDIFHTWIESPLNLFSPNVIPISGNTSTYFNFTVTYTHIDNIAPTQITVNISGMESSMLEVDPLDTSYIDGKDYFLNITHLDIGVHIYKCWATDGVNNTFTSIFNKPTVYNTGPNITTLDNLTVLEDEYYEVLYIYEDIDIANVGQSIFWNYSSNASWLKFDNITAILNGTPTQNDIGQYWVNISINDTMEIDWTNFTITVIEVNDDPIINTSDDEITYEDELYEVDYNATDIDSPLIDQVWALKTNASSWLDIDSSGIISGTPTNDEVGIYWVNVSVGDGENGLDFTNFSLTVLNVNDAPVIITTDIQTAQADELYEVDYNATDIDSPLSQQIWLLDHNATWLALDSYTGVLSGTPTEADAGWYNVNVSVDDGDGAQDWQEFVLTVTVGMKNEPPVITTTDVVSAIVDELYYVDYTAIDDHTAFDHLVWALGTNASWLSIETDTGILSGTPILSDVGQFWVNVSVMDEHHAVSYHNFTLTVTKLPIAKNTAPELLSPKMTPPAGDIETQFTFSVHYYDADNDVPTSIRIVIDGMQYDMMFVSGDLSNGTYEYKTKLSLGIHTYYFTASDGLESVRTVDFSTPNIKDIGENTAPELSNPKMTFSEGDTEIEFTFSVHYLDADGDIPEFVRVYIDGISYDMELKPSETPADGVYEYKINLSKETHTYNFTASDGIDRVKTNDYTTSYDGQKGDKSSQEDTSWVWLILIAVIVIIIILVVVFFVIRNKRAKEREEPEPELAPTAPPEVPEGEPPIPSPEEAPAVPPGQPPAPEVPPEQPPAPEPSVEQPPTPEVTPEPSPVPQVEEQPVEQPPAPPAEPQVTPPPQPVPTPQVEQPPQPQPQVVPQEPSVAEPPVEPQVQPQEQKPVPKVKDPQE